jgi:hypothetical protein
MNDRLKELMQELGNAINESLSDSDRIAEAIGEIKRNGYDVFLVLEATIGFNKRDDASGAEEAVAEQGTIPLVDETEASSRGGRKRGAGKVKLTSQDQKFLQALKISFDKDQPKS